MGNIRLKEKYLGKIDKSIAWRKKEITDIVLFVKSSSNSSELLTRLRIGYVMFYSHWEGMIKNITSIYLEYINQIQIEVKQLEKGLVFLHLKKELRNKSLNNSDSWEQLYNSFHFPTGVFYVAPKESITTQNLNFESFLDFIVYLGLEKLLNVTANEEQNKKSIETKKNLINERLVNLRNKVAHGERGDFDVHTFSIGEEHSEINSFMEIINELNDLMDIFKDAIINKIMENSFLAVSTG